MTLLKRLASAIERFDLGDNESIIWMGGPWPFRFFLVKVVVHQTRITKLHEHGYDYVTEYGFRVRTALASFIRSWAYSECTRCGTKITFKELINQKNGNLNYFMSGSISHRECPPPRPRREVEFENSLKKVINED